MSAAPDRTPLSWTVAWRFLRGRRSRLLGGTARAALAATALGVTAMVIAMALMTGYRQDLRRKLVEGNAPVVIQPLAAGLEPLSTEALARLEAIPEVASVGRIAYGQGTLTAVPASPDVAGESAASPAGSDGVEVTLRGVEPTASATDGERVAVSDRLGATAEQLALSEDGVPGAVLGRELARSLGVEEGDRLRLVVLGLSEGRPRFRYRTLRVGGTFSVGFAEFDSTWMLVDRDLLARAASPLDLYEVALAGEDADGEAAGRVVAAAQEILGRDWFVADWRLANRELFTALELQQLVLFLVLGLIVLVSTFNVASTLVVLVRERMRDVGVLASLGLAPGKLRAIFLLYGAVLGAVGIGLGVALGAGSAWLLNTFELIRFDADVAAIYFIDSVSFRVRGLDLAAIVGFSLVVNLLACSVPAWRAARVDPSAALRYE